MVYVTTAHNRSVNASPPKRRQQPERYVQWGLKIIGIYGTCKRKDHMI
jgi:hypothetical protein